MKVETHLPLGKVDPGVRAAGVRLDVARVGTDAGLVERLGYDGLVLTETKEDPFVVMALASAGTQRISLTTAVAMAFPRSPTATALTAWTLQRASGGRFVLGLGTQVKGHIERRYGMAWHAPGPWLTDYVGAVRAVWDCWQHGTDLDFHSEHYTLTLMNPLFDPGPIDHPHIPVHVAAVNAHMARVGGRIAEGVRPHPICTRRHLEETLGPAVRRGAVEAGRDPADVELCASPLIATAPDDAGVAARVSDVRARIAFYASTRTYRAVFETHGWEDVTERLSVLSRQGRWDEMERHVSDEMVETIAVVGTYDQIAERVWRRYEGVCDKVEFSVPVAGEEGEERLAGMVHQLRQGFPAGP